MNEKDKNREEIYSHYRAEIDFLNNDPETHISELIENADFEDISFNIGFEQGYMRGLEIALSLCDDENKQI